MKYLNGYEPGKSSFFVRKNQYWLLELLLQSRTQKKGMAHQKRGMALEKKGMALRHSKLG